MSRPKKRMDPDDWKNLAFAHFVIGAALIGVAIWAHQVTKAETFDDKYFGEDTRVPYYFAAFVIGGLHLLLSVVTRVYYKRNTSDRQSAVSTMKFYQLVNFVFWVFTVVSIVVAAVVGICTKQEICHYYDKYETNKRLAIAIIVLSAVSFFIALNMMDKTRLELMALTPASVCQSETVSTIDTGTYPLAPPYTPSVVAPTAGATGKRIVLLPQQLQDPTNSYAMAPPTPGLGQTTGIYQTSTSAFALPPPPSYAEAMMPGSTYPAPSGGPNPAHPPVYGEAESAVPPPQPGPYTADTGSTVP